MSITNKVEVSERKRGRGYSQDINNRFASLHKSIDVHIESSSSNIVLTRLNSNSAKSIVTTNQSPDVPFERSVNPYRGCEHGCSYCFARPTHAYLDCSPGLEFESKIFYKENVISLLEKEFIKSKYVPKPISLGNITDVYQPIEKKLGITRKLLQLFLKYRHPVSIVTKSSLIERDIDLLEELAKNKLVHVAISLTTLNKQLARKLEPRAPTPKRRLQVIQNLKYQHIPVSVLVAPVIPVLTDYEIENILKASKQAGASRANFVMLRLPSEMKFLFTQWLEDHYPLKSKHILNRLKEMHGGELYQSKYGSRMRGEGEYARMIEARFKLAIKKLGLTQNRVELDSTQFIRPAVIKSQQLELL